MRFRVVHRGKITSKRRYDINLIIGVFMLEGADPGGPSQTITLRESMEIILRWKHALYGHYKGTLVRALYA